MTSEQGTNVAGIYAITCLPTGKRYIGSAINIRKRWNQHRLALRKGKHHSRYLQRAWSKYGEGQFKFSVLEYVEATQDMDPEDAKHYLLALEQIHIDAFDVVSEDYGFNLTPIAGSVLGVKHTDEVKAANSAKIKAHHANPEYRAAMAGIKRAYYAANPDARDRLEVNSKAYWEDPEARAAAADRTRAYYAAHPEAAAAHSERHKAHFADPEVRKAHSQRLKAVKSTPEARANNSRSQRMRHLKIPHPTRDFIKKQPVEIQELML
jgi:group I intron endonuclease